MQPLIAELDQARRMGCEFEMTMPLTGSGGGTDVQNTLASVLSANGIAATARAYSHAPIPRGINVCVECDSSVTGQSEYNGIAWHPIEVKTRILHGPDDWEAVVPKCLAICRYMGARVNRSTGHHLHIQYPEATTHAPKIRSLFNIVYSGEPFLYSLLPPSRRSNGYARPLDTDQFRLLHGCQAASSFRRILNGWDRHQGLNLCHICDRSPRIEFRHHSGTLDANKARHWMRLLNRLVSHARIRNCQGQPQRQVIDLKAFDNWLMTIGLRSNTKIYRKVSPELRETAKYLRKRFKRFNNPPLSSQSTSSSIDDEEA